MSVILDLPKVPSPLDLTGLRNPTLDDNRNFLSAMTFSMKTTDTCTRWPATGKILKRTLTLSLETSAATVPKVLATKLCIGLHAQFLQQQGDLWPDMTLPVATLISSGNQAKTIVVSGDEQTERYLLEALKDPNVRSLLGSIHRLQGFHDYTLPQAPIQNSPRGVESGNQGC